MCGIVGLVDSTDVKTSIINGLKKLEYRGYDSAGMMILNNQYEPYISKVTGKIINLEKSLDLTKTGNIGIGHTRWATHGKATVENAHPHYSADKRFYLVHNGVIENYQDLRESFLSDINLESDTDTEIIVQLISKFSNEGFTTLESLKKTLDLLQGSYAIGLVDIKENNKLYFAKNKSPLLIAVGQGFYAICSDAMAMVDRTNEFIELNDKEYGYIEKENIIIFDDNNKSVERESYITEIDSNDISKGTYSHFMLKEIDEQPAVLRRIISEYSNENLITPELLRKISNANKIYFVAAGTSYHAGLIGKRIIEKLTDIPVEVEVASEFGYHLPRLSEKSFFIFLTQSGETADSRQVMKLLSDKNLPTLTITNVKNSTLWRESTYQLPLLAGPEIAVASTKAYTAQIAVVSILASEMAKFSKIKSNIFDYKFELSLAAQGMEEVINNKEKLENLAKEYFENQEHSFFIGRGIDYDVSLEAALKLKEISYIHTEGFAAGELKHGTISLIEDNTPVVVFINDEMTDGLTRGNIREVEARGAKVLTISTEEKSRKDDQIVLRKINELIEPLISIVPAQLLSYYVALQRGNDVDQPRNLAKSVTVE